MEMLKELANALIFRTSEGRTDATLFIIVDLINRVGPSYIHSALHRKRYAELNLAAGKKAIQTPDFASANAYIESGIEFLGGNSWETEYDLTLALYKNAAAVKLPLGKIEVMEKRLNEVFEKARAFQDTIDSMSVLVQSLIMCGKADKALEHSVRVLQYLGEPLPLPDKFDIKRELAETYICSQQISSIPLDAMPKMKDPLKTKAMEFLRLALDSSHHQKSKMTMIVSCRMVRLTCDHGINSYSALGMAGLAYSYIAVLRNYTDGYKLGKLALSLNKSPKLVGIVSFAVTCFVCAFKEPIQALLPSILENSKIAFKVCPLFIF